MSGDSGRVGSGSPSSVFARAPAEAQNGLAALATAVADAERRVAELAEALDQRAASLTQAREQIANLETALAQRDTALADKDASIAALKASLSWRFMAPFQQIYRPVRRLHASRFGVKLRALWRHPRNSHKRKTFRSNRMAEVAIALQRGKQGSINSAGGPRKMRQTLALALLDFLANRKFLLSQKQIQKLEKSARKRRMRESSLSLESIYDPSLPVEFIRHAGGAVDAYPKPKIAIQLHVHYVDLIDEFASYFTRIPTAFDLLVSITHPEEELKVRNTFGRIANVRRLIVRPVPNRGRDLASFFVHFRQELLNYDIVAHVHTKKSLYTGKERLDWRKYLLDSLLPNPERIAEVIALLHTEFGLIYPQTYTALPFAANTWLANKATADGVLSEMGFRRPEGFIDFPVGSMFWAKAAALEPLLMKHFTLDDFPPETGQTDGTLAHALERLIGVVPKLEGHKIGVLPDANSISWSRWRIDSNYLIGSFSQFEDALRNSSVDVVIFDIFDTLLTRPLLDAESVKEIVGSQVEEDLKTRYLRWRPVAEQDCRSIAGRDIDISRIFEHMKRNCGFSEAEADCLSQLEISIEKQICSIRPDAVRLLTLANECNKRVILASDMFLPWDVVESMLSRDFFGLYTKIYLSSDRGVRKDSGDLYELIMDEERVTPSQILVIGDNERSDFQIPVDMGCKAQQIIRGVELARSLPRWELLIDQYFHSEHNEQVTLGLVIQKIFSSLLLDYNKDYFCGIDAARVGYAVLGPIVASFSAWLADSAKSAEINQLFFLAREGKLLKEAYDIWVDGREELPVVASKYLVVSRRAVSVANIMNFDDICSIAKTDYVENDIENFLFYRFGQTLSRRELLSLLRETGCPQRVSVRDGVIGPLIPILERLEPRIRDQGAKERETLVAYLDRMGMFDARSVGVVDIGYSGTIQRHLIRLLERRVHGMYVMTSSAAHRMSGSFGVETRGAFFERIDEMEIAPAMHRFSFELEQLMSCAEAQVTFYEAAPEGGVVPNCKSISDRERLSFPIRHEIAAGALEYVREAAKIRREVFAAFRPSRKCAADIFDAMMKGRRGPERSLFSELVLDDDYCGRGLVG